MDLPRNLYKSPGSIKYNATKSYDTVLVNNVKEYEEAINNGFIDNFADALNGEITGEFEVIESVKVVDWKDLAEKAGIKGDDLKKFMKKSTENRQKYLDNL